MPIISLGWRHGKPPIVPVRLSAHAIPSLSFKVHAGLTINQSNNFLEKTLVKKLNLLPFGKTKVNGVMRDFYFIDATLVTGLMGGKTHKYHYRGLSVVASEHVKGLIIGTDLIRRGRLIIDTSTVTFCF